MTISRSPVLPLPVSQQVRCRFADLIRFTSGVITLRIAPAFVFAAFLIPPPVWAQDAPPQEHLAALISALMANGCTIGADNAQTVLEASGLNEDEARAAIGYLRAQDGLPRLAESVVTSVDGTTTTTRTCYGPRNVIGDISGVRGALIRMLAAHDCAMLIEDAESLLPDYGLEMRSLIAVLTVMLETGEVAFDGRRMTITPDVCAAPGE
jgi:hypothetical protein